MKPVKPTNAEPANAENLCLCEECDLLLALPALKAGNRASCPRCGFQITSVYRNAVERIMVFTASALICLLFSNFFGFMQISVNGQDRSITLTETIHVLFQLHELPLAAFIAIVIIGLPVVFIGSLFWLALSVKFHFADARSILLLRVVGIMRFWNMAEIFFLGILISMIKVAATSDISVGASFYFYALFNVFMIAALLHLDKYQFGKQIKAIAMRHRGVA